MLENFSEHRKELGMIFCSICSETLHAVPTPQCLLLKRFCIEWMEAGNITRWPCRVLIVLCGSCLLKGWGGGFLPGPG